MEEVRIPVHQARKTVLAVLEKAGLNCDDAVVVADALIDAELTGRRGHGLSRVPGLVRRARGKGSELVRIARDSGTIITLDCRDALGYLASYRAARLACERLAVQPLVAVGCHHSSHAGAVGYYARLVADEGHWALATAHCSPMIVPHGGRSSVYGTNPIALACPGPTHPLVADLSPGLTTYGAVMNARHQGEALPEGVALDGAGQSTCDPHTALDGGILPMAGPKGSALAFLVQALSGALVGAAGVPEPGNNYGFLLVAMRSDAFVGADQVREELARLVQAVHTAEAHCPGDRSETLRQQQLDQGIPVPQDLWSAIQKL